MDKKELQSYVGKLVKLNNRFAPQIVPGFYLIIKIEEGCAEETIFTFDREIWGKSYWPSDLNDRRRWYTRNLEKSFSETIQIISSPWQWGRMVLE